MKCKQVKLEELHITDDMSLYKKAIAMLTNNQDYKTLNTLFCRNPNTSKFDTRSLNEGIPQETKRFMKRNDKLCNVSRMVPRKQATPQSDTYEAYFLIQIRILIDIYLE